MTGYSRSEGKKFESRVTLQTRKVDVGTNDGQNGSSKESCVSRYGDHPENASSATKRSGFPRKQPVRQGQQKESRPSSIGPRYTTKQVLGCGVGAIFDGRSETAAPDGVHGFVIHSATHFNSIQAGCGRSFLLLCLRADEAFPS